MTHGDAVIEVPSLTAAIGFQSHQQDEFNGQEDDGRLLAAAINLRDGPKDGDDNNNDCANSSHVEMKSEDGHNAATSNALTFPNSADRAMAVESVGTEVSGPPRSFTPAWFRFIFFILMWVFGVLVVRPVTFLMALRARRGLLPPIRNPILTMRAAELADAIRRRELRAEEVVSAYVSRIREVNPILNAVVDERFAEALDEARQIDAHLDHGDASLKELPLIGVPFTVKESIAVKGLSFRAGKPLRPGEERCAATDAPNVQRLRAAGAVPLCVTNTPELCLWWESYNSTTGYTVNPYDTRLSAGGSSGGEGALLGSAASILGLGSDVAGSCRLPAFYCGVSGHKPTPMVVPWTGHTPDCEDPEWPNFFTQAPMARHVADLPIALQVMASDKAPLLRLSEKVDLQRVRVFYVEREPSSSAVEATSEEVRAGIRKAVEHLRSRGLSVQKLDIPGLEDSFAMACFSMLMLKKVQLIQYDPKHPDELRGVWGDVFRFLTCRSPHTMHSIAASILFKASPRFPKGWCRAAAKHRARMQAFFKQTLGEDAVLLYPPMPNPAPRRHLTWHRVCDTSFFMLFNALGLPVTQVPLGLGASGRPIGVQVAGNKYQDRLTLAIGQELEQAFGGWVSPPSKE